MTLDGEIPTSYFLIISIGLTILSYLVYKKNGKSLEVYFLSVLTIIFYLSYFILIFVGPEEAASHWSFKSATKPHVAVS